MSFFNKFKRLTTGDKKSNENASTSSENAVSRLTISAPTNVKHQCHVGFDQATGTLTGLPLEWQKWLEGSMIRYDDDIECLL